MKLAPAYLTLVLINAIDVEGIVTSMRFSQVRKLACKWLAELVGRSGRFHSLSRRCDNITSRHSTNNHRYESH